MSLLQKLDRDVRRSSAPQINVSPKVFRQRSSSLGFSDIFRRKKFLSVIGTNNESDQFSHLSSVACDSPRIWRVRNRNSLSESLVGNLAFETLFENPSAARTEEKKVIEAKPQPQVIKQQSHTYTTCLNRFDVIGFFKDFTVYGYVETGSNKEGRNLIIKTYDSRYYHHRGTQRRQSDGQIYNKSQMSSPDGQYRWSRASSYAADLNISTGHHTWSRTSSCIDDLNISTSYWDLRIPSDELSRYDMSSRRNSWSPSVGTMPRLSRCTRDNHIGDTAKPCNSSLSKAGVTRFCNGTDNMSRSSLWSDLPSPDKYGSSGCMDTVSIAHSTPIIHRRSLKERNDRHTTGRKRSRSVTYDKMASLQSKVLHRSRSADFSNRPKHLRRRRQLSSLVRHIPFSDIEGSDASDEDNSPRSTVTSVTSSRRGSHGSTNRSSSSIEICSSSDDKDSGYQKTDEGNDDHEREHEQSIPIHEDECLEQHKDDETNITDFAAQRSTTDDKEMVETCTKSKSTIGNINEIGCTYDSVKANRNTDTADDKHIAVTKKIPGLRRTPITADDNKTSRSFHRRGSIRNKLEFKSMSVEDLMFCSGRNTHSENGVNDVKDVFEAINKEAEKIENKDKDMMVMFLVGGELKVLKRSAASGHGDRIRADIPSMTRSDYPQHNGKGDYIVYSGQPTSDIKRPRPKSEVIIGRSQSFAGMAEPSPQKKPVPGAMVLGESFRHHRGTTMPTQKPVPVGKGAVGVSFRKSPKIPKVPRPNRALLMFQSVKKGIREFIDATKEDIDDLQSRDLDGTSTAQQLKSAERYLKRLEFHLSKLDELHEFYMVQQQLREGVRTMHKAYVTSPGSQRNTLSNVKYGYKECTQTMCNIEAQLEAMMGTFNCKLKGIAGFARLCPGDVFEVTTRHGTQKWKTKGRIEKTGNQKWDIPEYNFKAVVGDIINIKGVEVRAFKSILLGQKSCETKDLFSANPQLMTVSINVNGSLKLSMVITWNPLDGVDETMNLVDTPRQPGTPRRRPVSVIAINGGKLGDQDQYEFERRHSNPPSMQQPRDENFILRTTTSSTPHINNISAYHGLDSPHVGSRVGADHLPQAYHHAQFGPLYSQSVGNIPGGFSSTPALYRDTDSHIQNPANQNSVYSSSLPPVMSHLHFPSVSLRGLNGSRDTDSAVSNIEDVVHNLSSALEDYHGQYTELNKLEELVKLAHKLLRKQFRNSSRSSSISVSIEDALEAFDFLDTEESVDDPQSPPVNNTKSTFDDMLCSPESTAKTADSGIESLAQRLSEDTQLGSSMGSSPLPPSLGNEEVDQCLMYHLTYCERLLENLGAFGPLKCREIYALDKLQKQSTIIENLLKLAKSGSQVDLHSVMSSLCDNKSLREFWVKCTDHNSLYVSPDKLLLNLEQKFAAVISEKHQMDPAKVCQHIITRILDIPDYEAEQGRPYFVITLHQFMLYFNEEGGLKHVEDVAEELKLVEKLMSGNSDMVIKAILTLRDSIPTAPCLKVIGMLLVTLDKEVEQCTISYLSLIQKRRENRDRAMVVFVEGLEDRTAEIRAGACAALAILEASESIDQLVYLWQSDSSQLVQNKAKEALQSMGEDGKKAFQEAQLSRHGFQGVQVHKGTFM